MTPPITPAEIAALKDACEKRTPGEWKAQIDWFDYANEGIQVVVETPIAGHCFLSWPVEGTRFGREDPDSAPWTEVDEAKKHAAVTLAKNSREMIDARAIVLAVNAAPKLVAEIERLNRLNRCKGGNCTVANPVMSGLCDSLTCRAEFSNMQLDAARAEIATLRAALKDKENEPR